MRREGGDLQEVRGGGSAPPQAGGMKRKSASTSQISGMVKSASGQLLSSLDSTSGMVHSASGQLLSSMEFHSEEKWREQGGWTGVARRGSKIERDASMVNLLNLVDPESLVDKPSDDKQHSALSNRGVALVGGITACAWYGLRLFLRDVLRNLGFAQNDLMELHTLSTVHSLGWTFFLAQKAQVDTRELPRHCSRALVAALGFYLHDCWALRGTLIHNPGVLLHQGSLALTISSIIRSKGVAWLAIPIMSQAVPQLLQEFLRLCGTAGISSARPEVRGLRLLWFLSFVASKLALIPTWLKHHERPEMHQPNLWWGKLALGFGFALNVNFLKSAIVDLPRFLRPLGPAVSLQQAYQKPLQGAQAMASSLVAATVLSTLFGSYASGPAAAIMAGLALRSGSSRRLKMLAGGLGSLVLLDQALPQPKKFPESTLKFTKLFSNVNKVFNWRMYPKSALADLPKDRHHFIAITPHGMFPWGAGALVTNLMEEGYMPNFMGASILGKLPIAGRLLRNMGFRAATKTELLKCFKEEYPRNVTVILPGGIREMFQIREDIEISSANLHSGFCTMAKEGGVVLHPGYSFGVSQLYQVSKGPIGDFLAKLSSQLKTSIVLFTGRWGTLLPYPHEMACALGKPIDMREVADGESGHKLYIENLREVYEKYKADFGWEGRDLFFEGEEMPPPPKDRLDDYTNLPSSNIEEFRPSKL